MKDNFIRIIVIGVGPHSKRTYLPSIQKLKEKWGVELCLVVDLKEKEQDILTYLGSNNIQTKTHFIDRFEGKLPESLEEYLNKFVVENKISGVIIATEPLAHKCYAEWALKSGLNILMDKPITTRKDAATNMESALGIQSDYLELFDKYKELQKKKDTIFSVNVQRRYHPGFICAFEKIKEISSLTNCPVTSIQSTHSDGQWRLPTEIVTQDYHPYNVGYGKASHSGYHIFDAVYNFYKASQIDGKYADQAEVVSSFVRPNGFIKQLGEKDYYKYFGPDYKKFSQYSDKELEKIYKNYGEIDASAVISLLKEKEIIANISVNLMHNGFARRNWITPGSDLYKGNGRVKHEYHNIEQGPFQNIQIHSYQSNDKHDTNTKKDYRLGGNNHFDIYIFRNIGITGDKKPLEIIRIDDLAKKYEMSEDRLVVEQTKTRVLEEFFGYMLGISTKKDLTSNIDDHAIPVSLMSSVYQSNVNRLNKKSPLVRLEFKN